MFADTNLDNNVKYMIPMRRVTMILISCFLAYSGIPQDGADLFKRNCAACHTIGGGRLVGPDLAGITNKMDKSWIIKFIRNSADMIKSGDPHAVAIGKEYNNLLMPPYAGSDIELSVIINYIESKGGRAQSAVADTFLNASTENNFSRGKALFSGNAPFKNGGASCITCHSVHDAHGIGGTLAKSLNLSYVILKGPGVKALLQTPPFPAMTSTYQKHPLTDLEIYDLAAYLKSVSRTMVEGKATVIEVPFLLMGIAGWSFFILVLFGLWRIRKRLSVNHEIFARQLASEK